MSDELSACTLDRSDTGPTTCLCTGRPGCQYEQGADVCTDCGQADCWGDCGEPDRGELRCPCGGGCWDERPPARTVETVDVAGGVL